jgi:two-component system sensor histidine kinase KdpD
MKSAIMRISSLISRSSPYVFAIGLIVSVTAILFALRDGLDTTLVALLYLVPLGLIAAYWGIGPGITSALIAFLSFNYFFIRPYYTLAVHQPTDVVILIIFLIVAVAISQLVGTVTSEPDGSNSTRT